VNQMKSKEINYRPVYQYYSLEQHLTYYKNKKSKSKNKNAIKRFNKKIRRVEQAIKERELEKLILGK